MEEFLIYLKRMMEFCELANSEMVTNKVIFEVARSVDSLSSDEIASLENMYTGFKSSLEEQLTKDELANNKKLSFYNRVYETYLNCNFNETKSQTL